MIFVNTHLETDWCEKRTSFRLHLPSCIATCPCSQRSRSCQKHCDSILKITHLVHPVILLLSDTDEDDDDDDDDDDINDSSRNILSPASLYCI